MWHQVSRSSIGYRSNRGSSSKYVWWCTLYLSITVRHTSVSLFSLSAVHLDVMVCGRPAAPNMSFTEQELSLENVLSLSPVHLCGTLYLQITDSSLTLQLFLNANLKVVCFVVFLLSNFLRFYRAMLTQSAVMRLHVVRPSVCPSVCDDQVLWSHTLEYFENNFTAK